MVGIRDRPIAPGSPWQNGFAERLIGSIRRECVDHLVVLGEMHLRRVLKSYARYCNKMRTHRYASPRSRGGEEIHAALSCRLISSTMAKILIPSLASYVPGWPLSFRMSGPPA
jgi:transposase InsO family protein